MAFYYTFGDVLRYNDLERNELKRWTQAGLIRPAVEVGESVRRFSARNLVEAGVCRELRGVGMSEALVERVLVGLNRYWDDLDIPIHERPNAPTFRACSILWISVRRHTLPPDDELHETFRMCLVDLPTLITLLAEPETGVALPLGRICTDLERRTGDRFDFTPQPVETLTLPAQRLEAFGETLATTFTTALTNALTTALEVNDQSIGDEKVAAIISAITDAFKPEKKP